MTGSGKSRLADEPTVRDDDPVERAAALSRLASDGQADLEAAVAPWLGCADPLLRAAAARALIGRWRLGRHSAVVEALFAVDSDWAVRRSAALALAMWARGRGLADADRARVAALLMRRLRDEGDVAVQEAVHEAPLRLFDAPAGRYLREARSFDATRDVDWDWLRRQAGDEADGAVRHQAATLTQVEQARMGSGSVIRSLFGLLAIGDLHAGRRPR